jgi:hypothetical protein
LPKLILVQRLLGDGREALLKCADTLAKVNCLEDLGRDTSEITDRPREVRIELTVSKILKRTKKQCAHVVERIDADRLLRAQSPFRNLAVSTPFGDSGALQLYCIRVVRHTKGDSTHRLGPAPLTRLLTIFALRHQLIIPHHYRAIAAMVWRPELRTAKKKHALRGGA